MLAVQSRMSSTTWKRRPARLAKTVQAVLVRWIPEGAPQRAPSMTEARIRAPVFRAMHQLEFGPVEVVADGGQVDGRPPAMPREPPEAGQRRPFPVAVRVGERPGPRAVRRPGSAGCRRREGGRPRRTRRGRSGLPRRRTSSSMQGRSSLDQRVAWISLDGTGSVSRLSGAAPPVWRRRRGAEAHPLPPPRGVAHGVREGAGMLAGRADGGSGRLPVAWTPPSRRRRAGRSRPGSSGRRKVGFSWPFSRTRIAASATLSWRWQASSVPCRGGRRRSRLQSSSSCRFHALDDGLSSARAASNFMSAMGI